MSAKGRVRNCVKALRLSSGLTQQQLADRVGATRQTVLAIEAEKYAPSLELAFRMARLFAMPFEQVFWFEDEEDPSPSASSTKV